LKVPVLLAWAEDDPVIPISFAREYMERVARLRFITYAHGGHSAAPKNADDFAPEAIAFLQRIAAEHEDEESDRAPRTL
jgi:pimeloyl-ACP methyl ester carboxylesterase